MVLILLEIVTEPKDYKNGVIRGLITSHPAIQSNLESRKLTAGVLEMSMSARGLCELLLSF